MKDLVLMTGSTRSHSFEDHRALIDGALGITG